MTRREAKIEALKIAYKVLEQDLCNGDWGDDRYADLSESDKAKITAELDEIAQGMYDRHARLKERRT